MTLYNWSALNWLSFLSGCFYGTCASAERCQIPNGITWNEIMFHFGLLFFQVRLTSPLRPTWKLLCSGTCSAAWSPAARVESAVPLLKGSLTSDFNLLLLRASLLTSLLFPQLSGYSEGETVSEDSALTLSWSSDFLHHFLSSSCLKDYFFSCSQTFSMGPLSADKNVFTSRRMTRSVTPALQVRLSDDHPLNLSFFHPCELSLYNYLVI